MQIRSLSYIPQSRPPVRVPLSGHNIPWEAPPPDTRWSDPLIRSLRDLPTEKLEIGGALTALAGAGLAVGLGLEGHTSAALVSWGMAGLGALSLAAGRALDSAMAELEPRASKNLQVDLRRSQALHQADQSLRGSKEPVQHHRFAEAEVLQAGDRMLLAFPKTGRCVLIDPSREVPVQQYRADGSWLLSNRTSENPLSRFELDSGTGTLSASSHDGKRQTRLNLNTGEAELSGPGYRTLVDAQGTVIDPPRPVFDQLRYAPEGLVSLRKPETGHYHLEPVPFDLESFGYKMQISPESRSE